MLAALGLNPDQTTTQINSDLDHLVSVGARTLWLVLDVSWAFPSSTTIDAGVATKLDACVNGAVARGMQVAIQAQGNPSWIVTAGGHTYPGNPWHGPDNASERGNWIACVHAFLGRYSAGAIHSITCWNEPNLVEFWVQGYDPRQYMDLLRDFYTDVKATWPAVLVDGHAMARNHIGWLYQHYAWWDIDHGSGDGATKHYGFDRLNVHPYCGEATFGYAPDDTSHADITTDLGALDPNFLGYRRLRTEILNKEGFNKPLVFGEFGYATLGSGWFKVTEDTRAAYLAAAMQLAHDDGYVDYFAVYYHRNETPTDYATSFNIHGSATETAFTATVAALAAQDAAASSAVPELALRVGFTVGPGATGDWLHVGDPVRGKVGTGKAASADATITLPPELLLGGTVKRGANTAESPVVRYEAGSGSWQLDNGDRRFEPTNLAGPYVAGGVSQVKPMRIVSFAAKWAGVSYQLWYGFSDRWPCDYDTPGKAVTTLQATGVFKALAVDPRAPVSAVGAGERTGERIGRILDSIGWASTARILAVGQTTVQATTLEGNPLEEAQKISDTEIGHLFEGEAGHVVFQDRYAMMADLRAINPQVTWQVGTSTPHSELASDHEDVIANRARITRIGGAEQTAEDANSVADFLPHTHEDSDLWMETDGAAAGYASMIVALGKEPRFRFISVTVDPALNPTVLWPVVLGAKLGDRHRIVAAPPGGGTPITQDVFVRGIQHAFEQPTRWAATFTFQAAEAWSFLTVGHATLGRVGYNKAAF